MKILHINKDYADNGGTEQYLYDLCRALETHGHETVVIYGEKNENTWHVPGRSEYFVPGIHASGSRANGSYLTSCIDIIERENPDIINFHITFNSDLIERLRQRRPLARSLHSPHLYCLRNKLFRTTDSVCGLPFGYNCLLNAYLRRCADPRPWNLVSAWQRCDRELESNKKVPHTVVFSRYMKECLLQNKFEEDKITVLPYFTNRPVEIEEYDSSRERLGVDRSRDNLILFVGRITREKGLGYLLRAVKQVSVDYRLLIIGDGWYLNRTKALAKELGLGGRVEFPGWISNEQLGCYYSGCSVLVIPSIWPEPFGIVGLEAMSHAKPVVAFDVGGISEWLKDGETGFLVESKNVRKMAAKIELLLRDKKLAGRMGEKGRVEVAEKFSPARHVSRLIEVYESAIESA